VSNPILDTAKELHAAGISVVPVQADGSKRPAGRSWKQYTTGRATAPELDAWFTTPGFGLGVVTGAISGNLEMAEVEGRAADRIPELTQLADASGLGGLWHRLNAGWVEQSPTGGVHWLYRLDGQVPGNTKIARTAKRLVLAETRGEGGFVVVAPSAGTVHETGRPWIRLAGGPATAPKLTAEDREAFHHLLATLGEDPAEPEPEPTLDIGTTSVFGANPPRDDDGRLEGISPLDDYEQKTDWADILVPEGWTKVFERGRTRYWRRPGKNIGISATTGNAQDRDRLYVFTSSTEFEPERPYTKQGAYALLHHGGDHSKAASALRSDNFGAEQKIRIQRPQEPPQQPMTIWSPTEDTGTDGALAPVIQIADRQPKAEATVAHSDDGNAVLLVAERGDILRYNPDRGRWLVWNGTAWKWQPHGGGQAREIAKDVIRAMPVHNNEDRKHQRKSLNSLGISNMLGQAQTDPAITVTSDQLDAHPWELNTPGGILDLRTGTLRPPDPTRLHTRTTACTPDFEADRTLWHGFLADTFPCNAELVAFMKRLIGYTAVGEVREHILPFAHGDGGNGKGVLMESIAAVLGDYATSTGNGFLMASSFQQHSTDIAGLAGIRMAMCSEVNEGDRFDEAKVKLLTGGDRLTARFMRQDNFTFTPTHTLWLAGNHQPHVTAGGDGFWRRLRLIPFLHTVPEDKILPGLADILAKQHGPALLAWVAEGAAEYAATGLREPSEVRAATKEYAASVDTVGRFLEDACYTGAAGRSMTVTIAQFRTAYEDWCRANGENPLKGRTLAKQLQHHGVLVGRDAPKGPNGVRMYGGIGLRYQGEPNWWESDQ
jgi:P4 family phage/plasmid primase-like protien